MKTLYVEKKSDLSLVKQGLETAGLLCYRVRTVCQCKDRGNQRDGIIVIRRNTVWGHVVRCKACAGNNK